MGARQTIRETLYGVYNGGAKPGMRCVKQGDWKLIEYQSEKSGVRETQLFNLRENPHEFIAEHHDPKVTALTGITPESKQTNLAKDPQHAAKLEEMRALLLTEMRRLDDPWRFSGQPDDGISPPAGGKGKPRKKRK
jgi:hypothetical protein